MICCGNKLKKYNCLLIMKFWLFIIVKIKLCNWEYWLFKVFYYFIVFYLIWFMIKVWYMCYWLVVNFSIYIVGMGMEFKFDILKFLFEVYCLKFVFLFVGILQFQVEEQLWEVGLIFLLIVKFDFGFWGLLV